MQLDEPSSGWHRCKSCGSKLKVADQATTPSVDAQKTADAPSCNRCGAALRKTASHCHQCGMRARNRFPIRPLLMLVIMVLLVVVCGTLLLNRPASVPVTEALGLREELAKSEGAREKVQALANSLGDQIASAQRDHSAVQAEHQIELRRLQSEIAALTREAEIASTNAKRSERVLTPAEAIIAYTRVIEMKDAPAEQVAKALYFRALIYCAESRFEKADADYTQLIEMKDAPVEQVAMALLGRGKRNFKNDEDLTRVIEMRGVPVAQVAEALFERGFHRNWESVGQPAKAIEDMTRVIEMKDAPATQVANALWWRAVVYKRQGNFTKALADYTQVIEMKDAPAHLKADAEKERQGLQK